MSARAAVKQAAAACLNISGARNVIASVQRHQTGGRRVVVVGYHRVCADFDAEREGTIESCLIGRETFRRHVEFLADRFELVTMSRAVDVLAGRVATSRDVAAITFDDGYADVVTNALPILHSVGAPATIYISSEVVEHGGHFPHDRLFALLLMWQRERSKMEQRVWPSTRAILQQANPNAGPRAWLHDIIANHSPTVIDRLVDNLSEASPHLVKPPASSAAMRWDGVRTLAAAGWDIGAHTTGHFVLTHLDPDVAELDLRVCRAAIEAETRHRAIHFAYCNGYYSDTLIKSLRRAGFVSAVTTEDRPNRIGDDPYRIARRVLWERSAAGVGDRTSYSLLACQLDGAWTAAGFNASESGRCSDAPVISRGRRSA